MSRTVITSVTGKGGVVRVINSATGDIARTTNGWIEDEKYGIYFVVKAATVSGEFDSAVTRSGSLTLKLSTSDVTGRAYAEMGDNREEGVTEPVTTLTRYSIPVVSSTSYKFGIYCQTYNAVATSAVIHEYNSSGTRGTSNYTNTLTGTQSFTLLTNSFTTAATTAYVIIEFRLNATPGNISDAWFDVNSMTLEQVSSITNSSSTNARYYPSVTAVTSTDNIDQAPVTVSGVVDFGNNGTRQKTGYLFTPTKKNVTGLVIKKDADTGTFTGTVTISLQQTTFSLPNGTTIGTPVVISNVIWEAITNATDYTINYPITLIPGTTYALVIESSTQDASNKPNIQGSTTGGTGRLQYDGSIWSNVASASIYLKTLYSKNTTNFTVSTDTQTVSVTAPTPDGWASGSFISLRDYGNQFLTLTPGVNNIYFSSNGPATADGTLDPSLQGIFDGDYSTGSGSGGKDENSEVYPPYFYGKKDKSKNIGSLVRIKGRKR